MYGRPSQKPAIPHEPLVLPEKMGLHHAEFALRSIMVLAKYNARIYRSVIKAMLKNAPIERDGLPHDFFKEADRVWRGHSKMKLQRSGEFSRLQPGERGIVIGNHPTNDELFPWFHTVTEEFSPNACSVIKREFLTNPFLWPIGVPAKLGGFGITINRSDGKSALQAVEEGFQEHLTDQRAVCILTDGTRPTKDKIAKDRAYLEKNKPEYNAGEWLHHTPRPRIGGSLRMIQAAEKLKKAQGYRVRILNTTVGSSKSTVFVHGEEVFPEDILGSSNDPSDQRRHAEDWFMEEWEAKNGKKELWSRI